MVAPRLLLETGDYLLLEDGSGGIILQPVVNTVTLTESGITVGSDTLSRQLIATRTLIEAFPGLLLLETGDYLLLEDGVSRLVVNVSSSTPAIIITDTLSKQSIFRRSPSDQTTVRHSTPAGTDRSLTSNKLYKSDSSTFTTSDIPVNSLITKLYATMFTGSATIGVYDSSTGNRLASVSITGNGGTEQELSLGTIIGMPSGGLTVIVLGTRIGIKSGTNTDHLYVSADTFGSLPSNVSSESFSLDSTGVEIFIGFKYYTGSEAHTVITDTLSRMLTAFRSFTESHTVIGSDTLTRTGVFSRILNETNKIVTDLLQRKLVASRAITESHTIITDTVSRKGVFSRIMSESHIVIGSDTITRTLVALRTFVETHLNVTDVLSRSGIFSRAISEAHTVITDTVSATKRFQRSLTEAHVTITDTVSYVFVRIRGLKVFADFLSPKQVRDVDFSNPKRSNDADFSVST